MVGDEIISEYINVLQGPRYQLSSQIISAIINCIYHKAEFVTTTEKITVVAADPTDNKFLEAAIAGDVDTIVSGDGHLLELREFRKIPIITAKEFITQLDKT